MFFYTIGDDIYSKSGIQFLYSYKVMLHHVFTYGYDVTKILMETCIFILLVGFIRSFIHLFSTGTRIAKLYKTVYVFKDLRV